MQGDLGRGSVVLLTTTPGRLTGAAPPSNRTGPSRGLLLSLDRADAQGRRCRRIGNQPRRLFRSEDIGHTPARPGPTATRSVGWGSEPYLSRVRPAPGKLLFRRAVPRAEPSLPLDLQQWFGRLPPAVPPLGRQHPPGSDEPARSRPCSESWNGRETELASLEGVWRYRAPGPAGMTYPSWRPTPSRALRPAIATCRRSTSKSRSSSQRPTGR